MKRYIGSIGLLSLMLASGMYGQETTGSRATATRDVGYGNVYTDYAYLLHHASPTDTLAQSILAALWYILPTGTTQRETRKSEFEKLFDEKFNKPLQRVAVNIPRFTQAAQVCEDLKQGLLKDVTRANKALGKSIDELDQANRDHQKLITEQDVLKKALEGFSASLDAVSTNLGILRSLFTRGGGNDKQAVQDTVQKLENSYTDYKDQLDTLTEVAESLGLALDIRNSAFDSLIESELGTVRTRS